MKKSEKGSATLLVVITVILIIVLLGVIYGTVVAKRKSQLIETKELFDIYDGNMTDIYDEQIAKMAYATLTINANKGTYSGQTEIEGSNNSTITLSTPTREGYTFVGWEVDKGTINGNQYTFVGQDATIVANWQLNEYVQSFDYAGSIQPWTAPYSGTYKVEVWGAQGGCGLRDGSVYNGTNGGGPGGKGGYSTGEINITKGNKLYVAVGGKGQDGIVNANAQGGWNGGGSGAYDHNDNESNGGGGGATSIQSDIISDGQLKNYSSNKNKVVIVAGGGAGGGSSNGNPGSVGGGIKGGDGHYSTDPNAVVLGGTQTTGFAFGQGGNAVSVYRNSELSGGGGGYYGGYATPDIADNTYANGGCAGGGSGYIGGTQNGQTLGGNQQIPAYNGLSMMIGNSENGYAKITYLGDIAIDSNYTRVDCLVSSGAQYIDTGYKLKPTTGIDVDFKFNDLTRQQRVYGISHGTVAANTLSYDFYINGSDKWAYSYQNDIGNWINTGVAADTNRHNLKFNYKNNRMILMDSCETMNLDITASPTNNSPTTMVIFAKRNLDQGVGVQRSKMNLYSFKIYEGTAMVRDFVPCRRLTDNKLGLYDRINNKFYTNQGTGDFTSP